MPLSGRKHAVAYDLVPFFPVRPFNKALKHLAMITVLFYKFRFFVPYLETDLA
jgi:hypothetical protein